ncbi:CSN-associated deubiquitinating enzyme Ubp12 [Lunasporangiospora selenospora]|uniref:ubiquitinyl hydrolase 1 n=1 Tax=Lunasporangiospora selenospora TaxID=979761 RepID=A0A9P6FZ30_9FUNG|nr:CSN-associated deubiquitinating enzyme Ubp12 [Lunasporangiospora selenospora]
MYLSLPLPINKKWTGTVTYVPYDVRQPLVDISVQLPKGSSQRQLKEKIADMMGTQAGRLFSAEVFQNRFYKSHENWEMVDELGDADKTFIYELPVADFTNAPDHVVFPVFSMMDITHFSFGKPPMIGHPMLVCVSKEEAKDPEAIVAAIAHQAKRYTTVDLFEAASASDDTPEDAQEDLDMDLIEPATSTSSSSAQTTTRVKKGIFRVGAFTPPSPQQSKYRSMMKPSLYAPMNHPTLDSMTDIFERAAASRDSDSERELDVYHVQYHRTHSTMEDDDNEAIGSNHYARPGSPSTLSDSSRSSNRPPVAPQDSEQSEDDDEVNLARVPKREPKLPPSPEPLVRHGDLLYCLWDQSVEQGITSPKKYRSFSSRAFDDEPVQSTSTLRALWDERGASVTDPVIQEEIMAAKRGRKTITLEDCLNEFTKEEQLGEEDLWYCPDCKKHQQATKKLDIWRFPDVLVVHLKRFSHTRSWRDKLDALVDFPIEGLDLGDRALKELQQGDNIYDLFGVSNHMGGLGGGHYTAYAKNEKQDRWYCFDDSHVSPVQNQESIKTSSAYLLFYRRRSAPIKEYEQRPPVADPEPEPELVPYSMGRAFGPSMERADDFMIPYGPRPLHDQDDDDIRFGPWGKPPSSPYQDIGPSLSLEDSDREGLGNILDDDDELPMYSSSIGPASLLVDSKDFMTNKKARVSQDFDHLDNDDLYTDMGNVGHSPDLSTCASDGSNPGTANASPRFSPIQ